MKRVIFALAALGLASGCGILKGGGKPTTPTFGNRIDILSGEASMEIDPALANVEITLPPMVTNPDWAQPGGNPSHSMGHVSVSSALGAAWSVNIGAGSSKRVRLAAAPVVADGRIYVVDTMANLHAYNAATGAVIWKAGIGDPKDMDDNKEILFGGGASYDNGRVYATSGLGDVVAFDAATGNQIWRVRPGGPLRGAPTIADNNVYVVSQDNQMYALKPEDGSLRWTGIGTLELAGVFGAASPAAAQGTVVSGFSSGELTAYRYENGRVLWQDALARTSISTSVASLSDIDANPVIDQGRVYAIGQGGRMVAIELATGQRIWEINVAGISTPWVAGEWIFVVTDQAQLVAIARATGKIRWMTQLPRYRKEKDKKGPISWFGPVLAGNRLILASSEGRLVNVSPLNGDVQSVKETGGNFSLPPIVAGDTLYLMSDQGQLTAWR
jgi:outer membrane protein assembly factor BamB